MSRKIIAKILLASALLGVAGYGLYRLGLMQGGSVVEVRGASDGLVSSSAEVVSAALPTSIAEGEDATRRHLSEGLKAGDIDPANGRKIIYYHDPMVPGNKFDKPAKSPFMDMMLVPMYADGEADQGNVTVSPRVQQNLGVRTAEVTEGMLSPQVSAVGSIAFNERDQVIVQARAAGYVERLHVRATLDRVSKGQTLVDLYVPDWVAVQDEYLTLRRLQGGRLDPLVAAARQRMRQAGMSEVQIRQVEDSDQMQTRITVVAPIGGVLVDLQVREGMTVMPGTTLFRINGLSTVWANAEVPESQSALLRQGSRVVARSLVTPEITYSGRVQAILPEVNLASRTIKARMELNNPGERLVPGMFVNMQLSDDRSTKALLIPSEALIQTGRRTVVMLAEETGRFAPVEVEAGIEVDGKTEIKQGLRAGQRVVVSAQFLVDSEASLKGVEARLNQARPSAQNTQAVRHTGEATVVALDKEAITLSHGPIASLQWGAMTMDFKPAPRGAMPPTLKVSERVRFEFFMDEEGLPQLTRVSPLDSAAATLGERK